MDKDLLKTSGLAAFFASFCCLTPIVLFMFGLSTAAFASSLADTLYGEYKWVFRGVGLLLLAIGLVFYFRKKGICTLDAVKRRKNEIINKVLLALTVGILVYVFVLYVVLHYWGVWLGLWS